MKHIRLRKQRGFTLVETVIAMGIIAILMTAFLGAFGPALKGVQKSISRKEINRLASTLEADFAFLKGDEQTEYDSAFHKAYELIEGSSNGSVDDALLLYQYRGDPSATERADGTFAPQTDNSAQIPGEDYVLQSVIRKLSDSEVAEELQPGVVEGRVFYLKMTQLVLENDGMTLNTDGNIKDTEGNAVSSHTDYPEAYLAFSTNFYVLKSNIQSYVGRNFSLDDANGDGHPDATGKPAFSRNMTIMR